MPRNGNSAVHLRAGVVRHQGRSSVRFGFGIGAASQRQREIVVLQARGQRGRNVQVPERVGAYQQVSGDLARPHLGPACLGRARFFGESLGECFDLGSLLSFFNC